MLIKATFRHRNLMKPEGIIKSIRKSYFDWSKKFLLVFAIYFVTDLPVLKAQSNIDKLTMTGTTLIVRDLKASSIWYRKFLKFKMVEYRPEKHAKMKKGDFQLTLVKGKNTLLLSQITFSEGKKYVNGIEKIGFDTNQFDSLNLYFQLYEQKFYQSTYIDKNLNKKTFVISDPDGNKLQFFDVPDNSKSYTLSPSLFCINSSDYINTLKWYTSHFGFVELELKDDRNLHFQNLLKKENIILELIHLPYESLETTEFMPVERDLASFDKINFSIGLAKQTVFEMDNNGNKIALKK